MLCIKDHWVLIIAEGLLLPGVAVSFAGYYKVGMVLCILGLPFVAYIIIVDITSWRGWRGRK